MKILYGDYRIVFQIPDIIKSNNNKTFTGMHEKSSYVGTILSSYPSWLKLQLWSKEVYSSDFVFLQVKLEIK